MYKGKVLVTGAAGFIGSAVARKVMGLGYDVVTIDNLSTGNVANIPEGVVFIKGNLQDEEIISQVENHNFEAIFHIAGQSSGEISFDDPVYDLQSNTQSTLLLIQLALKTNCRKFIYASTMSVYGQHEDTPISEDEVPLPKSFYSVGKLASENYMNIYKDFGINFFSLRLFNVYGPGQNMDNLRQGMVSIFMSQAINTGKVVVKGDARRFRDMVYIDEVVAAFISAFHSNRTGHNIYNVCTGHKTTVKEVIDIIAELHDKDLVVEYKGSTPGDVFGIYGSNQRISEELGWCPVIKFKDGMTNMYKWAIQQIAD
jgi:UDP-glucose 4-epimerase